MPRREVVVWLEDARRAICEVEDLISGVANFDAFTVSTLHNRALERLFEIIGESLFQSRKLRPDLAITDLNKIIALRHVIIHDYYTIFTGKDLEYSNSKFAAFEKRNCEPDRIRKSNFIWNK